MNEEYKSRFVKNCDFLAKNTTNRVKLYNLLRACDILQDTEIEEIKSKGPPYERNTHLYNILVTKEDEHLPKILQCLEESNNTIIVKQLKCDDHVSSTGSVDLIWFDINPATTFYKGRNEAIQTIENCWEESRNINSVIFVGITGLGGIGKSELARNYALKFHTEIRGHCIWINSETDQTFRDSLRRLAGIIGVPTIDSSGNEIDFESITNSVYTLLSKQKSLIILDNLDSYDHKLLYNFVTYTNGLSPSAVKPFVLMTSRNQLVHNTFGDKARQLELQELSDKSAVSFFKDALSIKEEDTKAIDAAENICKRINNYPLCMQQAVAYIKIKKRNSDLSTEMEEYLIALNKESKKLLNHPLPKLQNLEEVSKTTYLTWQITLDRIMRTPEVGLHAIYALDIVSFFHSDNIDETFAENVLKKIHFGPNMITKVDKSINPEIFEILSDYSMCNRKRDGSSYRISLHRLVQEVCRIKLQEIDKLSIMANKILKIIHDNFECFVISSSQLIHIEALLKYIDLQTDRIANKSVYYCLLMKMSNKYNYDGKYRQAVEFYSTIIPQVRTIFGKLSQHALHITSLKCSTLLHLGKYQKAEEILKEVYDKQQLLQLEYKPPPLCECGLVVFAQIVFTINNLGTLYHHQGMYKNAMKMHYQVLEFMENTFGKGNQFACYTKMHISGTLQTLGKYKEALKMIDDVLEIQRQTLGREHPHTLVAQANRGIILIKLGRFHDAMEYFEELLMSNIRLLGKDHPNTLHAKSLLADVFQCQGNFEGALKSYNEIHDCLLSIFGEEHPKTLEIHHKIGGIYCMKGRYADALEIFLSVFERRKKVLSEEHKDTLLAKYDIAKMYNEQGRYELANRMFNEVLESQERIVGKEHSDTLTTKKGIASICHSVKNFQEALGISEEVLAIEKKIFGEEHPNTVKTLNYIGNIYNCQERFEEAQSVYNKVLEIRIRLYGEGSFQTLGVKTAIGILYRNQGKFTDSLTALKKNLEVQMRVFGHEHPNVLITKFNIGVTYWHLNKPQECYITLREVYDIQRRVLGDDHPNTVATKDQLLSLFV